MRLLLLAIFATVSLWAAIGKVALLTGEVRIERQGSYMMAQNGTEVRENDIFTTGPKALVKIVFNDETTIIVGKNSNFLIQKYSDAKDNESAKFKILKGVLETTTGKIGKIAPQKFEVSTKTSKIGVRGTIFQVQTDGVNDIISCTQGSIGVTELSTGATVVVVEGQKTEVSSGSAPSMPHDIGGVGATSSVGGSDADMGGDASQVLEQSNNSQNSDTLNSDIAVKLESLNESETVIPTVSTTTSSSSSSTSSSSSSSSGGSTNNAPTVTTTVDLGDSDKTSNVDFTQTTLLNDSGASDSDGDTLSVTNVSVDSGTITDLGSGNYRYTPPSADYFTSSPTISFDVTDGTDLVSATATLTLPTIDTSVFEYPGSGSVGATDERLGESTDAFLSANEVTANIDHLSWGYWVESGTGVTGTENYADDYSKVTGVWVEGIKTDTSYIQNLIDTSQTYTYLSQRDSAGTNELWGHVTKGTSHGGMMPNSEMRLELDFGGGTFLAGSYLSIIPNWDSGNEFMLDTFTGSIGTGGFSISGWDDSASTGATVSSFSLQGNYYGDSAERIGGKFNLEGDSGGGTYTITGGFIGIKQ